MDLNYSIIYSERKTISIIVERDPSVVVRAPLNASKEFIEKEIQKFWNRVAVQQPNKVFEGLQRDKGE